MLFKSKVVALQIIGQTIPIILLLTSDRLTLKYDAILVDMNCKEDV